MAARVLLIDEDKERRAAVGLILTSGNYSVVEAAGAERTLFLLANERFDLILLNITPPDRNGFRVLEFLKENHLATKVIVLTGTAKGETTVRNAVPGAREYISRPYNSTYILNFVEHALSGQSQGNLKLQIIKGGDLIKSTASGVLDLKASVEGLVQIAAIGAELRGYNVLIDLRDANSTLSTSDIFELANNLVEYGDTFRRKTALLGRENKENDQSAFFENVAHNRGFNVKGFTEFEDAITWLSSTTPLGEDQAYEYSPSHR